MISKIIQILSSNFIHISPNKNPCRSNCSNAIPFGFIIHIQNVSGPAVYSKRNSASLPQIVRKMVTEDRTASSFPYRGNHLTVYSQFIRQPRAYEYLFNALQNCCNRIVIVFSSILVEQRLFLVLCCPFVSFLAFCQLSELSKKPELPI